jgi:predicted nuclease of predicted toxin-antitoxin system
MKFKLDENIPVEASALLQEAGHDSLTVLDQNMGGEVDEQLLQVCSREHRALITLDLDFADIKSYPPSEHRGILILRIKRQSRPIVLEAINRLIPLLPTEPIEKQLWIVEDDKIRVRE